MKIFIEGTLIRDISLSFIILFIGFTLQFVIIFIYKWWKQPIRKLTDFNILWAILMMLICLQQTFFTIADFYASYPESFFWIHMGYIAISLGLIIFTLLQERTLSHKTRYKFTFVILLLFTVLMLVPRQMQVFLAIPIVIVFTFVFLLFSRHIVKVSSIRERIYYEIFASGVIFFAIGEVLKSSAIMAIRIMFYPFGASLLLVGIIIGNFALLKVPGFTEIGWSKAIREIFVIHKSGLPLLHAVFENGKLKKRGIDSKIFLTSGIITALQSAISEILQSRRSYMTINREDYKILIQYKNEVLVVIFADEVYVTIHNKMKQFLNRFCTLFKNDISNKTREVSKFQVGYALMEEIFSE